MIENYERLNSPSTSDSKLESAQMPVEPGQQLPLIEDDLSYSQTIFNRALNSDDGEIFRYLVEKEGRCVTI